MKIEIKDIEPKNKKGELHGYQQWYGIKNKLQFRGYWKNNETIGYIEWHIGETNFYIR
jgi:hypothetical protein